MVHGLVQVSVAGVAEVPEPMKPTWAVAPAASEPFQLTFLAVATPPLIVTVPFQLWLIAWPLGTGQVTVQPLMAVAPAFTVT